MRFLVPVNLSFVLPPGYSPVIFPDTGPAQIFGSWWALISAFMFFFLIHIRTWLEDHMLILEPEGAGIMHVKSDTD